MVSLVVLLPLLVAVVAGLAKALPIAAPPKEFFVSTVRLFVVYYAGWPSAHDAIWKQGKILFAGLAPYMVISALCCGRSVAVVLGFAFPVGLDLAGA